MSSTNRPLDDDREARPGERRGSRRTGRLRRWSAIALGALLVASTGLTGTAAQKLIAADGAAEDQFGYAVSADGGTVVVGSRLDDDNGTDSGSVYVFTGAGQVWSQEAKLQPGSGMPFDQFGFAVSIDADTVLAGARWADGGGFVDAGEAWVFTRSGTSWSEQAALLPDDVTAMQGFGFSVVVDGDLALIGAPGDSDGGSRAGAAYVFERQLGVWTQEAKLAASDAAPGDGFGLAVALDGGTALIGAPDADLPAGTDAGAAYVFERDGGTWTQRAKLVASDPESAGRFGHAVAASGEFLVVGAAADRPGGAAGARAAYVFLRHGASWIERQRLHGMGSGSEQFGFSVGVEGRLLVVGSQEITNPHGAISGSAYVYRLHGGRWRLRERFDSEVPGDRFGWAVAIDEARAVVGARYDSAFGQWSGAAYVFDPAVLH